MLKVENISLVV